MESAKEVSEKTITKTTDWKFEGFNTKFPGFTDNFAINEFCRSTLPCEHTVTINGVQKDMLATEIIAYCNEHGLKIPQHFFEA